MTPAELVERRKAMGYNQSAIARLLGMSLRGYQKLEAGESPLKPLHALAVDRVGLMTAVMNRNLDAASPGARSDALQLAGLITGE